MLAFIGIIAFIGAAILLVSSALSIISLGLAIIIKVAAAIVGIGCGILLLLFAIFLIEEMTNLCTASSVNITNWSLTRTRAMNA